MSNDIYKILNNFNKLTEQKLQPIEQLVAAKPKTQLQESIEKVNEKYIGFENQKAATGKKLGEQQNMAEGSKELGDEFAAMLTSMGKSFRRGPAQRRPESPPRDYSADIAALPELRAELATMQERYQRLGGSNWQYADREQNLTNSEREARSMEQPMQRLAMRIRDAEQAMKAQSGSEGMTEEQQDESALQAYLGKKKYGEKGMKALQQAGREGASKEKMAKIRAQHDKMDEQQGVAEGLLKEGQYEMMMRNGQVKKFIAKDDADAKRIAAGHGAKSLIRLKGGVPAGKVSEQGVAEGGPFSYGAKKPRKGSVADLANKKRQEQERGKQPIEPKDQMVGVAKVTKGVAEGMMDNPGQSDSPVAQAIIRRILLQRTDLLAKYGPEMVGQAVDEVADFVGDVEEIGSSDVSGWVRHVEQMLGNMEQGVAESSLNEKAVSKAQQKFMGMVHATKKGEKAASPAVAKVAKGMSKKASKDYASTKHKGLPQHVNETIIRALQEGYSREQIVAYLLEATDADREYWRELTKNIPQKGEVSRTVHKGHYGTEYQGDADDDDDDGKKKITKPTGEKRGRGRPKGVKNRVVRAGEKKASATPTGEKRGRGRPAGSKNKIKESWITENNNWIAEAYAAMVEKQEIQRLPAPMEPTYKIDPKTGELVPDIDYKLNPHLRPAPTPAPKPAPKPATDKRSEIDGEEGIAEMMRLAGMKGKLHGNQHKLDVDRDGKLEKSDFAKLRASKNEEQLDEKMYFDPTTGQTTDRTFKPPMAQSAPVDNTQFKADVDRAKSSLYMMPNDSNVYSRERGLGPAQAASRLEKRGVDIPGLVGNRVNPATMDAEPGMNEADMEEGNEFSGALAKAKASGAKEFKVDGKTYPVRENKLDECGEMGPVANGMESEQEGRMNVSTNMSSDGNKSVTVTADGDAALELMQILSLAGMQNHSKMQQPEIAIAAMEEKDTRYEASTTPEEDVLPLETQLKGGDGEVAGKEKQMNKNGSARFSDNPLAAKEMKESISLKMMKEYEGIKIKS